MNPPHHAPSVQQLAQREGSQQSRTQQETHTLTQSYTRKRFGKKRMQIHPVSCHLFKQISDMEPSLIWKDISRWAAEIRYLCLLWRPVTSFVPQTQSDHCFICNVYTGTHESPSPSTLPPHTHTHTPLRCHLHSIQGQSSIYNDWP